MFLLPSCDKVSPVKSSCDDNHQWSEPELLLAPGLPGVVLIADIISVGAQVAAFWQLIYKLSR